VRAATIAAENVQHKVAVSACIDTLMGPRSVASVIDNTNDDSMKQLNEFLCNTALGKPRDEEKSYTFIISAGADCIGYEDTNAKFSGHRRDALKNVVRGLVEQIPGGTNDVNQSRLRAAAADPKDSVQAQPNPDSRPRRRNEPCADNSPFWSVGSDQTNRAEEQWKRHNIDPWRAALIEVWRTSLDTAGHIHVSSELARETTLSDMLYFSFVSFTTTGYGDIKAVSGPVRFCVIVENILEIIFTAVFFTAAMNKW
jgi:hypothetical protein